jgi:hypothetical protein
VRHAPKARAFQLLSCAVECYSCSTGVFQHREDPISAALLIGDGEAARPVLHPLDAAILVEVHAMKARRSSLSQKPTRAANLLRTGKHS